MPLCCPCVAGGSPRRCWGGALSWSVSALPRSEAPIVGTGIEKQLAHDSRTQIMAEGAGVIEFVDASVIRIRYDRTEDEEFVNFEDSVKEYNIPKFRMTNQSTTIDLRPICKKGQRVEKGMILTEGYATENGELALGRNLKVAFMPWKGYNYEDAIVLNERMVREDILTSVHVSEYSLEVRETKRGMEELTSDIPNVSEDATKDLDERGIIRVGAHVMAEVATVRSAAVNKNLFMLFRLCYRVNNLSVLFIWASPSMLWAAEPRWESLRASATTPTM